MPPCDSVTCRKHPPHTSRTLAPHQRARARVPGGFPTCSPPDSVSCAGVSWGPAGDQRGVLRGPGTTTRPRPLSVFFRVPYLSGQPSNIVGLPGEVHWMGVFLASIGPHRIESTFGILRRRNERGVGGIPGWVWGGWPLEGQRREVHRFVTPVSVGNPRGL